MSILGDIISAIVSAVRGPMSPAETDATLDRLAEKAGEPLDWRHSIVDLMKVVKMDSSLEARKRLAVELGYTGALTGSADMNLWLHARVMEKIADHRIG